MTFAELSMALPEIVLACAAMLLLMLGVYKSGNTTPMVSGLAVASLVVVFLMVISGGYPAGTGFNDLFVVDDFSSFMKLIILIAAAVGILMTTRFIQREGMNRFEIPVLMLLATLGMMIMVSANDLMTLYIGLELQSLALYVIAAIRRETLKSTEAGLKYFVLGALSSGMLLYGSSLVYGFTGATNFDAIARAIVAATSGETTASIGLVLGLVFVVAAVAFKISAVPFHMWTPDVYEGAPTPVTAFFASAPKVAAMALFIRLLAEPFGDLVNEWQQIIVFVSIASMALGSLGAIMQKNIKRMMAYSSIGHVGYALVGVAAGSAAGIQAVAVYLTIYIFMNMGVFACILSMRQQGEMMENIEDLKGLSKTSPAMALALVLFMFSMAGVPPLAGFFGKYMVFAAAIDANLYGLAVIGVLTSVIAAFYYLRIIKIMYFDEPVAAMDANGGEIKAVMVVSSAFVLFYWLFATPIINGASQAAAALFAAG
ncbi:NADH-quinone oxidoreductase subunit NuoN [Kiloniella sp. b19]|uniref:NADH-quinone oxidoreductase subunit NuoN n=1 Tax=Kiloniella sp. GXU_MW_B19 TaxID=3141326 RepID=UPI0031DCBCBD